LQSKAGTKGGTETFYPFGLNFVPTFFGLQPWHNALRIVNTLLKPIPRIRAGQIMMTALRQIGNSRGVIIPAPIIEQLHLDQPIEMLVQDGGLLLKPCENPRAGWFEGYDPLNDDEPLADMKDLQSEQGDWEW
jgi:antitoxin MazE